MFFDATATAEAMFTDKRSYCKRAKDGEMLQYRFGDDVTQLRRQAFDRSQGFCESPRSGFNGKRCGTPITWESSEMHHSPSLGQGGDDSLGGVLMICKPCHVASHGRTTRFGRGQPA